MRFAIAALLLATIACSTSPTEPGSGASSATLRFGETAVIAGTRVSFTDIQDSRCPKEVVCAWAGDAAVRLESGSEYAVLHTNGAAGPATGQLAGVMLTLVEVKPDASSSVKKSDYVVTLRASK